MMCLITIFNLLKQFLSAVNQQLKTVHVTSISYYDFMWKFEKKPYLDCMYFILQIATTSETPIRAELLPDLNEPRDNVIIETTHIMEFLHRSYIYHLYTLTALFFSSISKKKNLLYWLFTSALWVRSISSRFHFDLHFGYYLTKKFSVLYVLRPLDTF